jgi:hypothetical protein
VVARLLLALVTPPLALAVLFAAAAIWYDGPASRLLAALLAGAFLALCAAVAWRVRPGRRAALAVLGLVAVAALWWLRIPPRNDRDWRPDVARPARATVDGDRVTIENVRHFAYRSEDDWEERWETRSYDLAKLTGVDLFLSYWGSPWIAHTIVSWEFEDGPPLAISIEVRKEQGESYSAVRGFFRQFELYYVVADERDVIGLRTNVRGERVWLYRVRMPPERARAILLDYLREVNELADTPRWYNALTHNCTTTIRHHVQSVTPGNPWNWRILVNGVLDQLAYARGTIDTSLPFPELRARSEITARARAGDLGPGFSERIREGLPGMPRVPAGADARIRGGG